MKAMVSQNKTKIDSKKLINVLYISLRTLSCTFTKSNYKTCIICTSSNNIVGMLTFIND